MHETGAQRESKWHRPREGTGSVIDTTWEPRRDDGRLRSGKLQRFLRGLLGHRVLGRVGKFAVFSGEDAV